MDYRHAEELLAGIDVMSSEDWGKMTTEIGSIVLAILVVLILFVSCGCATIEQTRINPDGSSYTAKGRVLLKGNIAELKTSLSEQIDHDGHYTLEIGQDSAALDTDALELIGLLNNLLDLAPIP